VDEPRTSSAHGFFIVAAAVAVAMVIGVPIAQWALKLVGINITV